MGTIELRKKIIERFNLIIQDESMLMVLDGVFDSMNVEETTSLVPDEHYNIVEERRRKYHAGESDGLTWDELKQKLKKKHGF